MLTTGMKSSEFWVTLASVVGLAAASIAGSLPGKWAAIASVVATAAYAVSRGLAKQQPVAPEVPTVRVPASTVAPAPPAPPPAVPGG